MPSEEPVIDEAPKGKRCPWKKHKKFGKFMKGKFLHSIVGTLRQVIREELNYALKGEVPPETETVDFNFKKFAKKMMCKGKPKFEVTEFTKVKKAVTAGEQ